MQRLKQILLAVFFVGLIAAVVGLNRQTARTGRAASPTGDRNALLRRYGFYLEETAGKAGIDFRHQAPQHLDAKLAHIMPQIASMGAAVSVADVNRDGWQDAYVTNSAEGSLNRLYLNQKNGTFRDVAGAMGVADVNREETGVSMGAVWGDYDNDGWEDLFLYKWGRPELFHNENGQRLRRVTEGSGLPPWVNANTAIWLDYDRDGKLDLFLGGYYSERVNLWRLEDTRMMPNSFEYATNGGRKYLLRGRGDGTFEDVTERVGIKSTRWALAAAAADLRGTGYPDLVVANDYGVSELYFNDGGKRFREVGRETGVGFAPKSGMNVAIGDILGDGNLALYITNITEGNILRQENNLWMPRAGTSGNRLVYDNLAGTMGVGDGGWSFGAQFGDLNNDGYPDLYLVNGYVSADRDKSYWYDYSKIAGANAAIIIDAKNWPPMGTMSLSGYQQKRVWLNDGAGRFNDIAPAVGVTDAYDGRSVALADIDNNGTLDVLVANQKGPLLLYKNTVTPQNHWIAFDLEGARSNRSAIGARVRLVWSGGQQVQEVQGGSGFCAENQRRLHFGLGANARVEKAEIRWPSGTMQTLSAPEPGKVHAIKEPV